MCSRLLLLNIILLLGSNSRNSDTTEHTKCQQTYQQDVRVSYHRRKEVLRLPPPGQSATFHALAAINITLAILIVDGLIIIKCSLSIDTIP